MRAVACLGAAPAVWLAPQARRRRAAASLTVAPRPLVKQQQPAQQWNVGVAAVARRPLAWQQQPAQQRHVAAGANPKEREGEEPGRGEAAVPQYRESTPEEERASPMAWAERGHAEEPIMVREDELLRSAGAQVAGGGVADEPKQAAAAPPSPSGAAAPSQQPMVVISKEDLSKMLDTKLNTLEATLDTKFNTLEATLDTKFKPVHKQLAALAHATAANAKSWARFATAVRNLDGYWPPLTMYDVPTLVDWMAAGGRPAELDAVLDEVVAEHRGFLKLRQLVLHRLKDEVPEIRSLADQFGPCGSAGWWGEELLRLAEVKEILQQQPEDEGEDARWWAPFVSTLQVYCSVAGKEGGKGLRRFLQKPRRDGCTPLVMMVAALAAGQLRTTIKFDGAPRLAVHGSLVTAEAMEIKSSLKGLREARQRLLEAGQVMAWLLRVATPDLINGRQLQLRGVIAVQGHLAASQLREAAREMKITTFGATTIMQLKVEVL